MEAKKFLFKSSSILSVAILLAGLMTVGDTKAQDIQETSKVVKIEKTLPVEKVVTKQDYFGLLEKASEVSKQKYEFQVRNESPPRPQPKIQPKPQVKVVTKVAPKPTPPPKPHYRQVHVVATAYTNSCAGCTGITSTGVNIKNTIYHEGYRVIATDPSVIPTHSVVRIETNNGSFLAIAEDKGGAIHGSIIDVLVSSYNDAIRFGRQRVTITILREGDGS
jgi:3D (Asp-Asp-Asp) domain-containing protein